MITSNMDNFGKPYGDLTFDNKRRCRITLNGFYSLYGIQLWHSINSKEYFLIHVFSEPKCFKQAIVTHFNEACFYYNFLNGINRT